MTVINMQTIRYINLLDKEANVKTTKCFVFNDTIFFAVPGAQVSRAIGPDANNIRKIQDKLGKRVKIIREASRMEDTGRFLQDVVSPIRFKSVEVNGKGIVVTAGNYQNKASLIGRNKRRLEELQKIGKDIFGMEIKVI